MRAYQLKVVMNDLPTVWRTLIVPEKISWAALHYVIQYAFGWLDAHLYDFSGDADPTCYTNNRDGIGEYEYYSQNPEAVEEFEVQWILEKPYKSAETVLIDDLLNKSGAVNYLYDYGDYWELTITLEKTIDDYPNNYALCVAAGAAAPPEDVGGTSSFMDFLEAWYDPAHSEHEDAVTWGSSLGFTGEVDLAKINTFLRRKLPLGSDNLARRLFELNHELLRFDEAIVFNPELQAEKAASTNFVYHYRSFLEKLKAEGSFKATAKGNLPVKVVKDLYARGFDYAEADFRVDKVHREADAWFISTLHDLCKAMGTIKRRKGRISLTKKGEEFLQASAVENYYALFWYYLVTYNLGYEEGNENLPLFLYPYLISLLARYGKKERAIGFYVERLLKIYPLVLDPKIDEEWATYGLEIGLFSSVMRRFFAEFGLVTTRAVPRSQAEKDRFFVRKTELFDDVFLRW